MLITVIQKSYKKSTSEHLQINNWYIVRLLGEVGFTIAIPLVVLILTGRWLDVKLGTKVVFTLLAMPCALIISSLAIYKKIKTISQIDDQKNPKK